MARDVPACHDLRIVGSGIGAGPAVLHDRMDHAKQLVGWGDDGPLVTLPRLNGAEAAVELAFLGPGGGARALNEDRPEHGIVVPGVPARPLAHWSLRTLREHPIELPDPRPQLRLWLVLFRSHERLWASPDRLPHCVPGDLPPPSDYLDRNLVPEIALPDLRNRFQCQHFLSASYRPMHNAEPKSEGHRKVKPRRMKPVGRKKGPERTPIAPGQGSKTCRFILGQMSIKNS